MRVCVFVCARACYTLSSLHPLRIVLRLAGWACVCTRTCGELIIVLGSCGSHMLKLKSNVISDVVILSGNDLNLVMWTLNSNE